MPSNEGRTEVDHILYATGYKVNLQRVDFLKVGNLIERIECRDRFPVLDNSLQTTIPGLFVTSLPAARDFGLFFAFTAAVRASARIVGRAIYSAVGKLDLPLQSGGKPKSRPIHLPDFESSLRCIGSEQMAANSSAKLWQSQ